MKSFLVDLLAFEADSRYAGTSSFHPLASLRKVLKGRCFMVSTFLNHCGAKLVTKGDLESIPALQATSTWFPIPHLDVVDAVERTLGAADFTIRSCQFSVSHANRRFFGIFDLQSLVADGVSLSVGLRNSNDKTFPIGFCIGNRTFVCDNLAFSSEIVISKRHTRFGEDRFREGIAEAINKLSDYRKIEAARIERLQHQELTNEQAESTILRAWDNGIVGTRMLRPLIDQWRQPAFPDFLPRTAWSLLSAYTYVAKNRQRAYPNKGALEAMQFQKLLAV